MGRKTPSAGLGLAFVVFLQVIISARSDNPVIMCNGQLLIQIAGAYDIILQIIRPRLSPPAPTDVYSTMLFTHPPQGSRFKRAKLLIKIPPTSRPFPVSCSLMSGKKKSRPSKASSVLALTFLQSANYHDSIIGNGRRLFFIFQRMAPCGGSGWVI